MYKLFHTAGLFLLLLSVSLSSHAALFQKNKTSYFPSENLPKESLVPGGLALIPFQQNGSEIPKVSFEEQRVMVLQVAKKDWIAVVGLSLALKPGEYQISITRKNRIEAVKFQITDKAYEAQYITLKDNKQVSPSKAALERIGQESVAMKSVFNSWSEQAPSALIMDYPVEGPLSSQFGLKRFFNNQPRNPHSGLDIAAPRGSTIRSPLSGRVAALGNYFFNGNTVLIDHGQGMISMYCHMDEILVTEGQVIKAGEILGKVGSTGRATGPHLHLSINLNNTRVEPLLFLKNPSPTR